MQSVEEKAKINRFLGSAGLGQLSDPGLISQIGFLAGRKIKSHDDLKNWLNTCEPAERGSMLEALKPYLKFETKPLDVYVAELGMKAEADQLPVWEDGKFRAYNPASIGTAPEWTNGEVYEQFGILPGKAIPKGDAPLTEQQQATEIISAASSKEHVWVVCSRCTKEDVFNGWCKQDAIDKMRWWGWRLDSYSPLKELCPKCAAS